MPRIEYTSSHINHQDTKRLIAVVGPTATGKTQLALRLARQFDGEIVSADSRQVYRHMDIGTAKPAPEELHQTPHHLINIVNPDEDFSQAQYQQMAYHAIDNIQKRQRLPLLVGGSGLYVWSVIEGWEIPKVPPDSELRHNLEERASKGEGDKLYQELLQLDPMAEQNIDRRNIRRVIRALEVHGSAREPSPRLSQRKTPPGETLIIGLTTERKALYRIIDQRVDKMIEQGLVEEVRRLVRMGYNLELPAMSGIGYRQIGLFLNDQASLDSAIQQIKFETHRFVRQQYNWFKLTDSRIKWFDIQYDVDSEVETLVEEFLEGKTA
ncbi:MAG: tRNA (adenosine(37)-N6)-dimethylallyltransferase MiaA [Chloroflexi bacterium]|nr:tRNA (adenosine(37)-N6)-dimethylallyltransferase MiaA [Chloroflexota bacterium]